MIPKIIHFCWLSGDAYPPDIERCILSWKKELSEYKILLWDTKQFEINSIQWVMEAFHEKKYAFAADYIRFYALYNYGGIYLDSDVEVIKSFNDLLNYKSFVGFEYSGLLEAAVIGAEKNCDWIKECLSWYNNRSFYDEKGKTREIVLPAIISSIYEKSFKNKLLDNGIIKNFKENLLLPYKYFSPKNCYNNRIQEIENAYTIHHFKTTWLKNNIIVKTKKIIHLLLIKIFGKYFHDKILYRIRFNKLKN